MADRLSALVTQTNDLYLLDYVIQHLTPGDPANDGQQGVLQLIRFSAIRRKLYLTWLPLAPVLATARHEQLLQLRRKADELLRQRADSTRDLLSLGDESLRTHLGDPEPLVRLTALLAIAAKRSHLEADLVPLLDDDNRDVRQVARLALVRLARGTDFGPAANADPSQRREAIHRWRQWWCRQDRCTEAQRQHFLVLTNQEREAASDALIRAAGYDPDDVDEKAVRLAEELIGARGAGWKDMLYRLRDTKGLAYSDALTLAIPRLPLRKRPAVRDALAERLTRMTARTLRDKLEEPAAEVRRAAAAACALKEGKEHIPDLIPLLDDDEGMVAEAARAALNTLSGEDFGPSGDAGREERLKAVAQWNDWWERQAEKKTSSR